MALEYATLEAASRAALIAAYNCSEQRRECGGVIYQSVSRAGVYYFTPPVTDDKPFRVNLPMEAEPAPAGWRMVADFHNHPCLKGNKLFAEFFSAGDVLVNDTFKTIGYMLDSCTGLIHRYSPGEDDRDDEEVDLPSGRVFYLTIGHIAGWIDIFR